MRSVFASTTALLLLTSAAIAQAPQPHLLRGPDGSAAVVTPAVPGTTTVITTVPNGMPSAMPAPAVAPTPVMTIKTVGDLQKLCAQQDTADQINSCLNLLSSAIQNIRATEAGRGSRYVCNGEVLQNYKVRATFLNWAQANPSFAGEDANRGVLTALAAAYHCPADNVAVVAPATVPASAVVPSGSAAVPPAGVVVAPAPAAPMDYPNPYTGY